MSKNKSSAIETAASPTSWLARHAYLPYLLPLLLLPIYVLRWSLNPDNYFYADDWNWLNYAANSPIREWLHPLPTYVYNDRPVGALFIRALYNLFGLNQVAFHAAYLALHLLNVVLAFFLGRILLKSDKAAFCSVLLFGCWGSALQAPTWVAAIFDLACCTFTLSAILAHLAGKSPWLTALFFIAAIRTKEFAIMIPLLLLADEAIRSTPWNKDRIGRVIRAFAPILVAAGVFGSVYLVLHARNPLPATDPYHFTLTRGAFTSGIEYYLGYLLYFPYLGGLRPVVYLILLLASIALRWRAESAGFLGFLIFLLPVLFLPHQRGPLYLYAPSVFFWIGLIGLTRRCFRYFPPADNLLIVIILVAIAWQYQTFYRSTQAFCIGNFRVFRSNVEQLRRLMPSAAPNSKLFISGLPVYMNVFDYGPCYSVRLVYRQPAIECVLYKSVEETRALFDAHSGPKRLLSYKDGQLIALQ